MQLGRTGVWWSRSWRTVAEDTGNFEVAAELEALGYTALWSSGRFGEGLSRHFSHLLAATRHIAVASGIVSIWHSNPDEIATAVAKLEVQFPGRFLLGLGTSHGPLVDDYTRPYSHMVEYLDALDAIDARMGAVRATAERCLHQRAAASSPLLVLACSNRREKKRAIGAHPYFVPVAHTERARSLLGPNSLLAPEVTVVLRRDPQEARELARTFTAGYLGLPNYVENLRTLGFDDDDVAPPGSDRLVDAVVCWGDLDTVVSKVRAHFDAGADHVCVQVIETGDSFPIAAYRELAPALQAKGACHWIPILEISCEMAGRELLTQAPDGVRRCSGCGVWVKGGSEYLHSIDQARTRS